MRILIEITHPAHAHFFRYAIDLLKEKGHAVAVTARKKDVTIELLKHFGIDFSVLSHISKNKFGLLSEMMVRDFRLISFCRDFEPDVLTGIGGVFAAHAGFILHKPVIVWDDTEAAKLSHLLTFPFVKTIYTPDCYEKQLGPKQKRYSGCHELAYLHPKYFTPNPEIVESFGIDPQSKFCIVRFISWGAHHDVGQYGFDQKSKLQFIQSLEKYARPLITSESPLPEEFEKYRLSIPPHQIHHVMAFSQLYVGEGATMATESALLGVPAVYINTLGAGTINMIQSYGLLKHIIDTDRALKQCIDWLESDYKSKQAAQARQKLLADKIDMTDFIVEAIEKAAG